jgi:hypothetical protein
LSSVGVDFDEIAVMSYQLAAAKPATTCQGLGFCRIPPVVPISRSVSPLSRAGFKAIASDVPEMT